MQEGKSGYGVSIVKLANLVRASVGFTTIMIAHPPRFISVRFSRLATECSYDYVFLFDGPR